MKNTDDFLVTQTKPSHATTKLTLFTVSNDEWNTKENTRKMYCTHCGMPKGTSRSNIKQ